jgi:hypothetical protein
MCVCVCRERVRERERGGDLFLVTLILLPLYFFFCFVLSQVTCSTTTVAMTQWPTWQGYCLPVLLCSPTLSSASLLGRYVSVCIETRCTYWQCMKHEKFFFTDYCVFRCWRLLSIRFRTRLLDGSLYLILKRYNVIISCGIGNLTKQLSSECGINIYLTWWI